jgi:AcrR family transcriptional regulator
MIDPPVSKGTRLMSRAADPLAKVTLLRAAEEIFAERGLAGAKVEDIARRAGLSKGAFYLHFDSKESALKQVVESFLARCGSLMAPPSAYPDVPEEPWEVLDFAIERDGQIFEFLWQNRATLRILGGCGGQYDYLVQAFRADMSQKTREWVEYWRRAELFREEVDPNLVTTLMNGAYHELTTVMLTGDDKRPPLEEWLEFAQETFVRAYGTPTLIAALESRNRRVSLEMKRSRRGRADRGKV